MRDGDQIWLISCRGMGCGRPSQLTGNLQYWLYTPGVGWQRSSHEAFLASMQPEVTTTFYVHGNRVDSAEARRIATAVYGSLSRSAAPDQPLQFVLWSWPSERIDAGPLEDIRTKADRTPLAGYYLGWQISQLPPQSRVTLIGYSFGARVVTGSLHLLGGGRLAGDVLTTTIAEKRAPIGAVLIAAAVDDDWLRPGMPHGLATSQIDRLLMINNSADSALRRYHLLYGLRHTVDAMGTFGPAGYAAGGFVIDQFDAACIVGKEHNWELYFGSPSIVGRMQPTVFASSSTLQAKRAKPIAGKLPATEQKRIGSASHTTAAGINKAA
jgi:hypothetical protein